MSTLVVDKWAGTTRGIDIRRDEDKSVGARRATASAKRNASRVAAAFFSFPPRPLSRGHFCPFPPPPGRRSGARGGRVRRRKSRPTGENRRIRERQIAEAALTERERRRRSEPRRPRVRERERRERGGKKRRSTSLRVGRRNKENENDRKDRVSDDSATRFASERRTNFQQGDLNG